MFYLFAYELMFYIKNSIHILFHNLFYLCTSFQRHFSAVIWSLRYFCAQKRMKKKSVFTGHAFTPKWWRCLLKIFTQHINSRFQNFAWKSSSSVFFVKWSVKERKDQTSNWINLTYSVRQGDKAVSFRWPPPIFINL